MSYLLNCIHCCYFIFHVIHISSATYIHFYCCDFHSLHEIDFRRKTSVKEHFLLLIKFIKKTKNKQSNFKNHMMDFADRRVWTFNIQRTNQCWKFKRYWETHWMILEGVEKYWKTHCRQKVRRRQKTVQNVICWAEFRHISQRVARRVRDILRRWTSSQF